MPLLAVPNYSEGRDPAVIAALRTALDRRNSVLDRHSDREHNRTVFTLAGEPFVIEPALEAGADVAIERIDMRRHRGLHPCIGAIDVCPVVYLAEEDKRTACDRAASVAETLARQGVPVFFYGELATSSERRERAYFRQGGFAALGARMRSGEVAPDMGPALPHQTAGATLITARAPLAAFNVELRTEDPAVAQRVAATVREAGGGLPGVRAIGLPLERNLSQVSMNIHDPLAVPLAEVVARVRELAAAEGAVATEAELVGLIPEAALAGYPEDLPIRGFDPEQDVIERRLADFA
jgi:glutamate formiminotransferase